MKRAARLYFGHFLHDACPTSLLASPEDHLFLDNRPDWPDTVGYVEAFGLNPAPERSYFVRSLSLPTDHGLGPHRAARMRELHRRARAHFGLTAGPTEQVYLRRPSHGAARLVANEDALTEMLAKQGFKIVDPDGMKLVDLADALGKARLVITIDGSHQDHVFLCAPPGAAFCAIIPSDGFTTVARFTAHAHKNPFGYCVGTPSAEGYQIDHTVLLKTIELFD